MCNSHSYTRVSRHGIEITKKAAITKRGKKASHFMPIAKFQCDGQDAASYTYIYIYIYMYIYVCTTYHIAPPPANMTTQSLSCTYRAEGKKKIKRAIKDLFFFFMACLDEVHCVTTSALRNYKTAKVETEKKKRRKTAYCTAVKSYFYLFVNNKKKNDKMREFS